MKRSVWTIMVWVPVIVLVAASSGTVFGEAVVILVLLGIGLTVYLLGLLVMRLRDRTSGPRGRGEEP